MTTNHATFRGGCSADTELPDCNAPERADACVDSACDDSPHDDSADPEREPCPTPLAWQEVLSVFRSEADLWELRRGETVIQGRTWGTGPPLYLVPALGGTHELYALLVWLLRENFRCVVYDDFRLGRRSRPTPQQLADHLFAVADREGDRQFRLFAPALGSVAALTAMLARPERIEAAALQGGFAHRRLTWAEKSLIALGRRLGRNLSAVPFRQTLQTQNHLPWFPPIDQGRWMFFVENTGQIPVASLAARADVLNRFDMRGRLADAGQPVLLLRTEGEGRLAAECQQLLEQRLPQARVESLHTSGQLPYLTHPHRVAKLLKTFFLGADG